MIALHLHHLARSSWRRHAELISHALDDECRDRHGFELGQPTLRRLLGSARRLEGEGEAEHGDGAGCLRRAAGDSSARRATADDDLQTGQFACPQVLDDGHPRLVELRRPGRRAPTRDPVGLLDQRDADLHRLRGSSRGQQIRGFDASTGAMAQDESAAWRFGEVQVSARGTSRSFDLDDQVSPRSRDPTR
jgi:hypothetical protein